MKEETKIWLDYAEQNLQAAIVLLKSNLFNPTLQNIQQAVEKTLKALFIEHNIKFRKTHSISELVSILKQNNLNVLLSEDQQDLLDSIYVPSRYPVGCLLPEFEPNRQICEQCLDIASQTKNSVKKILKKSI